MKNNEKYVNIEVVVCIKRTSLQRRIAGARQATGLGLSTNDRRGLRIIRRASLHRGRSHTVDASEPWGLYLRTIRHKAIHLYLTPLHYQVS